MNIFVGNLNFQTTDDQLQGLFSEFGEVSSAKIIFDKFTNRSRGFGFVEMPDNAAAQQAIDKLNSSTFDRNVIVVNEARPREERPSNFGGNRDRGGFGNRDRSFNKRY